MKFRIIVILFIVSVSINLGIAYTILASGSGEEKNVEKNGDHCSWTHNPVCYKLNLTDDQIKELETCRKRFQTRIFPIKGHLKEERQRLFSLLKHDHMDQTAVDDTQKKICTLQSDIQKHFIHHFSQIKRIFTTDQQKQFYFYFEQGLCQDVSKSQDKK